VDFSGMYQVRQPLLPHQQTYKKTGQIGVEKILPDLQSARPAQGKEEITFVLGGSAGKANYC